MRGKVKTIIALLCSLLFLIACYTIVYLFFRSIKSFSNLEGDPSGELIIYFFKFVIPLCSAYMGFRLCYSGRIDIKRDAPVLLVSSFLGLFLCIYYFEFEDPIICCSEATAIHRIRSELNGRENLRWAKVRTLYSNFDTDEEIEREIVFGKTHGGWDTYIADMEIRNVKCDWVNNPTPTGGSIICSAKDNIKATFIRTGATRYSPAYWESYFD